ncbi:MAG: hypothetical protein GWN58_38140 [Anaerolineae bacterium]|nr:hypothetical protein [Anaerolineae bacterium]
MRNTRYRTEALRKMSALADVLARELQHGSPGLLGPMLHENWQLKRQLASGITSPQIDEWYEAARRYGARGGKITGAGGGGFLLLYAMPEKHKSVLRALRLREVPFDFSLCGSRIIYNDGGVLR